MLTAVAVFLIVVFTRHVSSFTFVLNARKWRRNSRGASTSFTVLSGVSLRTSFERQILLEQALGFNQTAAVQLVEEANLLRSMNGTSPTTVEDFWNGLLTWVDQEISQASLPWWTSVGVFARFSRRARRAALRRVLDLATPHSDDEEASFENDAYRFSKRRRSLAVLVRSLAATTKLDDAGPLTQRQLYPAIREIEKQARLSSQSSIISSEDRKSRLPPGLETPKYTVLAPKRLHWHSYEVRLYEPFSVCSVSMLKPRPLDATKTDSKLSFPAMAGASAFGALAGYLFGKNQQETPMKMTTPVLSSSDNTQMSFILPSEFWDDALAAPKPLSGSGVSLLKIEGEIRAVIMFGGYASRRVVKLRSKQLLDGLKQDSKWKVDDNAPVLLAQYNDPFTPPWKRLNEVSVTVTER